MSANVTVTSAYSRRALAAMTEVRRDNRSPFIFTGSRRDCGECGAYSGHFTYCDKTRG